MLCCCMPAAYASPEVHICPMVDSIQQSDKRVIDSRHLASEQESVVPEEHDCCCLTSFRALMNSHPAADWADLRNCLQQTASLKYFAKAVYSQCNPGGSK